MRAMRFVVVAGAGAVLLGLIPPAEESSAQSTFTGIAAAKDGDSLMVGNREVRLFGIDAPEWSQTCKRGGQDWACGQEAATQQPPAIDGRR